MFYQIKRIYYAHRYSMHSLKEWDFACFCRIAQKRSKSIVSEYFLMSPIGIDSYLLDMGKNVSLQSYLYLSLD